LITSKHTFDDGVSPVVHQKNGRVEMELADFLAELEGLELWDWIIEEDLAVKGCGGEFVAGSEDFVTAEP
jgi:hypothetical protein